MSTEITSLMYINPITHVLCLFVFYLFSSELLRYVQGQNYIPFVCVMFGGPHLTAPLVHCKQIV